MQNLCYLETCSGTTLQFSVYVVTIGNFSLYSCLRIVTFSNYTGTKTANNKVHWSWNSVLKRYWQDVSTENGHLKLHRLNRVAWWLKYHSRSVSAATALSCACRSSYYSWRTSAVFKRLRPLQLSLFNRWYVSVILHQRLVSYGELYFTFLIPIDRFWSFHCNDYWLAFT